jgi:hypothetical protein
MAGTQKPAARGLPDPSRIEIRVSRSECRSEHDAGLYSALDRVAIRRRYVPGGAGKGVGWGVTGGGSEYG